MKKIFVFCNSCEPEWHIAMALGEDGHFLASHACSAHAYIGHDMGFGSDWKHETYDKFYPDGWELEWVEDARTHAGVAEAYRLNQEMAKAGTPPPAEPSIAKVVIKWEMDDGSLKTTTKEFRP